MQTLNLPVKRLEKEESDVTVKTPMLNVKPAVLENNGSAPVEATKSMLPQGRGMQEIANVKPQSKESGATSENPIEKLEPSRTYWQKEISTSIGLLDESSALLFERTKSMLASPVGNDEIRRPDLTTVIEARHNLNCLAKLVQTKVNLIKAVK